MTLVALLAGIAGTYAFTDAGSSKGGASFPGFPLVRPAFAQTGTTFPDPDAGLSAYIQVDPAMMDLNKIGTLFHSVLGGGNDYAYGILFPISMGELSGTRNNNSVRLYADEDGTLLAYLSQNDNRGTLFRWTGWDPASGTVPTVLEEALRLGIEALGIPGPVGAMSWYDWFNPNATHLVAVVAAEPVNLNLVVPDGIISTASYSFDNRYSDTSTRNGLNLVTAGNSSAILSISNIGLVTQAINLTPGVGYTFQQSISGREARLGIVFVYNVP